MKNGNINFVSDLEEYQWFHIAKTQELEIEFLTCFAPYIPDMIWPVIAQYQNLTSNFILDFHHFLPMDKVLKYQRVHQKTIKNNLELFTDHMWFVSRYQYLTEEFMNKNKSLMNWKNIFKHQAHIGISFIKNNFRELPRGEYIYDPLEIFNREVFYNHRNSITILIDKHNDSIKKRSKVNIS